MGTVLMLLVTGACVMEAGDETEAWEEAWDEPDAETEKHHNHQISPPNSTVPVQAASLNESHLCEMRCTNGYHSLHKQCLPIGASCVFYQPIIQPGVTCQTSDTIIGSC